MTLMSTECVLINWFTSYSILSIRFPTRFCICTGIFDEQAKYPFDSLVSNQLRQSNHWPTHFCVHSSQVYFKSYLQYNCWLVNECLLLVCFQSSFVRISHPVSIYLLQHVLRWEQSTGTHLSIYRSNHVALHLFPPNVVHVFPPAR